MPKRGRIDMDKMERTGCEHAISFLVSLLGPRGSNSTGGTLEIKYYIPNITTI